MKRILCIGDSNTFGHDPRSYGGDRYPREVRWTGRLERPDREVLNHGHNGACIPQGAVLDDTAELIQSCRPLDAAVIMLGTNDLLRGASAAEAARRMEGMLVCLREACAEKLLLVAPPPMKRGSWVPTDALVDESKKLGRLYRETAARQEVFFADAGDWDVELIFDGVHFSPEGHAAFARGLSAALEKLL